MSFYNKLQKKFKIQSNLTLILCVCAYIITSCILTSHRQPFWFDELFTLEVVKAELTRFVILVIGDGKPPLYYLFVKFYSLLFNNQGESFLRFSSVILGIPFIIYAYKFLIEFLSKNKAKLILFVIVLNPLFLVYSSEFRMYSLLASATVVYFYYYYKAIVQKNENYSKKYFFSKIFLISSHYIGLFIIFAAIILQIINQTKWIWLKDINKKKLFQFLANIKSVILKLQREIIFFVIIFILIYLQTKLFPNFSIFWVPHFDIYSLPNTFLILLLGLDPGAGGKTVSIYNPVFSNILPIISIVFYLIITTVSIWIIKIKSSIKPMIILASLSVLIIILNSISINANSFYLERYMIGLLLILELTTLAILALNAKRLFIILITIIIFLNSLFFYNVLNDKVFVSYDMEAKNSIHHWYTEELDKCGWFYFDKIKRCP